MKKYINYLKSEEVMDLSAEIKVSQDKIKTETITDNEAVKIVLFSFDKGKELKEHSTKGDVLVTILEGSAEFQIENKSYTLNKNETLIIPAGMTHKVFAKEKFKMILIIVFPY